MHGTCAILCACVPSGCFLPSRADLPSLARLPLVSRGVFIVGDHHSQKPDRINGEETMTAAESADLAQRYDPRDVQEKWQARWAELEPFRASEDPADPRGRFYLVDMFPYPSGDLHMGHAEAYAIGDALARYHFLRGENVLHPIGWDAFGLPAENAAIRNNTHPADWTYANIETQAASFRRYATSFDWSRRLQTCDPAGTSNARERPRWRTPRHGPCAGHPTDRGTCPPGKSAPGDRRDSHWRGTGLVPPSAPATSPGHHGGHSAAPGRRSRPLSSFPHH